MLAVVMGELSMFNCKLKRSKTDVAPYVEDAIEGTNRAASLTQRLLAFSCQQLLASEAVDPNGTINGMTVLLARSLEQTIVAEARLMSGLWLTVIDRSLLGRTMLNLPPNARDAMPGGLALATAYLSQVEAASQALAPRRCVAITLSDTGTGMSEEVKARAFGPFFSTKGVGEGTRLDRSKRCRNIRQSAINRQCLEPGRHGAALPALLRGDHRHDEILIASANPMAGPTRSSWW
jgi:C4-dicarboxylate-specific signal transduction histidine kinase